VKKLLKGLISINNNYLPLKYRKKKQIDPSIDFFMLGNLLYESLFGYPIFYQNSENDSDLLKRKKKIVFPLNNIKSIS